MALTVQELQERRHYIGSSDVPAILGCDPYRNIADVWLAKSSRLEIKETTSRPADLGNRLERPLVEIVADQLEQPVEFDRRFHRADVLSAQTDGWLTALEQPVEAKAMGLFNPRFDTSEWGEEGTDQVPFRILAQVSFSLLVTGAEVAHVSALLGGGLGHRVYTIPRHEQLLAEIEERALAFWHDHVLTGVPPAAVPSLDTMKDVIREPGKAVEIDPDYPDRWGLIDDQHKLIKTARDELKAEIIHALGDAEQGVTPFGTFTYEADKRGRRTFRFRGGSKE